MVPSSEWAVARDSAVQPTNEPTSQSDSEAEGATADKLAPSSEAEPAAAFDPDAFEAAAAQLRPSWAGVDSGPPEAAAPVEVPAAKAPAPAKATAPVRNEAKVIELPKAAQARGTAPNSPVRAAPAPSIIVDDADELIPAGLPTSPKKGLIMGGAAVLALVLGLGFWGSSSDEEAEQKATAPAQVEEAKHAASEAPARESTPVQAAVPTNARVVTPPPSPAVAAPTPVAKAPEPELAKAPEPLVPPKPVEAPAKVSAPTKSVERHASDTRQARSSKKAKPTSRSTSGANARDLVRSSLGSEPATKPRTQTTSAKPKSGVGLVTANPY